MQFDTATEEIKTARDLLEPVVTSLWSESYSRSYPSLVTLQILTELEEVCCVGEQQ